MSAVTVSSKYQVVIPKEFREDYEFKPGSKVVFVPCGNTLQLVRVRPIEELRGLCKGMDTTIEKEPDRF